jgi:Rod binding domain-containing protein
MPAVEQEIIRTAPVDTVRPLAAKARDPKLDAACRDFEGLLLGFILKQGLNQGLEDEEDADGNAAMLTDFAAEQTARELGRAGTIGISDMLYEQISGTRGQPAHPAPAAKGAK